MNRRGLRIARKARRRTALWQRWIGSVFIDPEGEPHENQPPTGKLPWVHDHADRSAVRMHGYAVSHRRRGGESSRKYTSMVRAWAMAAINAPYARTEDEFVDEIREWLGIDRAAPGSLRDNLARAISIIERSDAVAQVRRDIAEHPEFVMGIDLGDPAGDRSVVISEARDGGPCDEQPGRG